MKIQRISYGKILSALLLLFLGFSSGVKAESTDVTQLENAIYIDNFEAGIGKQAVISLKMKNSGQIRGYQCDIYLPDGMTFAKDASNNFLAKISGGRVTTDTHQLMKALQDDGSLRLLCSASEVNYFSGNDGEIAQITVDVSESMAAGSYPIYVKNIKMGATSNPAEGTNIDVIENSVDVAEQNYILLDENSTVGPETSSEESVTIKVRRTIKAGNWSTICLPIYMSANQIKESFGDDVKLATFSKYTSQKDGSDVVGITVDFTEMEIVDTDDGCFWANTPYLICTSRDIKEFMVTVSSDDYDISEGDAKSEYKSKGKTVGSFIGAYHSDTSVPKNSLFLNNNKFVYSAGATKMMAYRAYFTFNDVLSSTTSAGARITMSIHDGEGNTTEIRDADFLPVPTAKVYTLNGQCVGESKHIDSLPKGIYVVNGKKVIK